MRAGELTIDGGKLIAHGKPASATANGNGSTIFGAAVGISQHTTKLPIKVEINGGIFEAHTPFYQANPQNNPQEDLEKIQLKINGGNFVSTNGGSKAVYSENFTGFISGGVFSDDVVKYTVDSKCSIRNADSKYEVKDCPSATNFYTSKNNAIPVVLEGTNIKLEETRAVLRKLVLANPSFSTNELIGAVLVLPLLKNVVEIKEVEGEKLLFVNNAKENTTQVYREKTDGIFGDKAFENNTETEGKSADISFDLKNAIAPSWVDKNEAIKSYNVVMTGGKEI